LQTPFSLKFLQDSYFFLTTYEVALLELYWLDTLLGYFATLRGAGSAKKGLTTGSLDGYFTTYLGCFDPIF
jgi:hypothetical protein